MQVQAVYLIQYFQKMFHFKNGALLVFSAIMTSTSGLLLKFSYLLEDTDIKRLLIPVIIQGFCLFAFSFITSADLYTGVKASKKINEKRRLNNENVVASHRLYKTVWKVFSVSTLTCLISFFAIVSEFLESVTYNLFIWILVWLWLVIIGFEWKSIGENLKRIDGKKPAIFMFMDRLLNGIEKKGIKRLESIVGGEDDNNLQGEKD